MTDSCWDEECGACGLRHRHVCACDEHDAANEAYALRTENAALKAENEALKERLKLFPSPKLLDDLTALLLKLKPHQGKK